MSTNSTTGYFTAPVDVIYEFAAQVCVTQDALAHVFIEKRNDSMTNKSRLTASVVQPRLASCYSVSAYAQLTRNEHVWLLLDNSSTSSKIIEYDQSYWKAFTETHIQRQ
ncbi:hypothetical protein DPMN_182770 [Dreissena polymorpha]|uniref:C1q domain-containing protein n=1 Tax=Dreissena polymorpha TaxID=45954 RepID=A0A9D4I4Z1_DREPO|nr:hypothetical protein DPMN_182770 [Dreissena polymorpha]